jgi:Pectate lyase superfamily protein
MHALVSADPIDPGPPSRRARQRRRRLAAVAGGLAVVAALLCAAVAVSTGSGPSPLVPRPPRDLVLSPFAVGGDEGAMIAGMKEAPAANAATTGQVTGPDYAPGALVSQAPGRAAVTLRAPGQYVQFTVRARANAIDVSYALRPGTTAALTVQVDGAALGRRLALDWSPRHAAGAKGHVTQYFSDARMLLGRQLEPGQVIRLSDASAGAAVPVTIALADFYQVPAPAPRPRSSVSVVADGADPTGRHDSAPAFRRAIQAASAVGRAVWVPPGTFRLGSPLLVTRATIIGAGSWYTVIKAAQLVDNPPAVTGPVNLSGLAIEGPGGRGPGERGVAISGSLGLGSVVSGLWIQGTAGGLDLSADDNYVTVQNSQILSTQGAGVELGPGVFGAWVRNDLIRNTAGDGVALWSDSHATVSNDTVVEPVAGNGIGDYGGADNVIVSNVVTDTGASGSGIDVADPPSGAPADQTPLAGTITVADSTVLRSGSASSPAGVPRGAVAVDSGAGPVSNASITFGSDNIEDSPFSAIDIGTSGPRGASQPVNGVTFEGDTIKGTGTVAIQAETGGSAVFRDVTGAGIGVPGIFEAAQAAGKPRLTLGLGPGNAGWTVNPVLTSYPRQVLPIAPGTLPPIPAGPSPTPRATSPASRRTQAPPAHESPSPVVPPPAAAPPPATTAPPPPPPKFPLVVFIDEQTGLCLENDSGEINTRSCTGASTQSFELVGALVKSVATGACMIQDDVSSTNTAPYNNFTRPCSSANDLEHWKMVRISASGASPVLYNVIDDQTDRCVDSNTDGDTYNLPCSSGDTYQEWIMAQTGTAG